MTDYISLDNAMRISGMNQAQLHYHARVGNIRTIKVPGKTWNKQEYHIDDCRKLGWPGTWDIGKAAGVDPNYLSSLMTKYNIPAATKIGKKWRFHPRTADMMVRWARNGYPVPFGGIRRR